MEPHGWVRKGERGGEGMGRERPRSVRVVSGEGWADGEVGRWVVGRLRRMSFRGGDVSVF